MRNSTRSLLYKELRLVVPPSYLGFTALTIFQLIPHYPFIIGVTYFMLALFIVFSEANANKDHLFTISLPIPRNRVVLSKHLTVMAIELTQLLFMVPFAIIAAVIRPGGNLVGMDGNYAFFGFILISFAVFNLIFLPGYFKTGYKTGRPGVLASIGFSLSYGLFEFLVNVLPNAKKVIDTLKPEMVVYQVLILAIGVLLYAGSMYFSYQKSVMNFDRVNL